MKKNYPAELRSDLLFVVSKHLDELLLEANYNAGLFGELRKCFCKLDLLVVVSYDPWSKWPWKRTPVTLASNLSEPDARRSVVELIAPQIVDLILREVSDNSQKVLLLLSKEALLEALKRFYVNEFTGDALAHLELQMAVETAMNEQGVLTQEELRKLFSLSTDSNA